MQSEILIHPGSVSAHALEQCLYLFDLPNPGRDWGNEPVARATGTK